MNHTVLIDRILEAERAASLIAGEAEERQARQQDELAAESARIREEYMERAAQRLESLRETEQKRKEQTLAAQDSRLAEANARMERAYGRYGDNWVDTLFRQVVEIR